MSECKWVSFYGNAMSIAEHKAEGYSKNITLRYPVYCPFGGQALRLTMDNYCGTEPICITQISAALQDDTTPPTTDETGKPLTLAGTQVVETTLTPVTFGGQTEVLIPAGERAVSDPISLPVPAGDTVVISFYLGDFTQMRSAVIATGPLSKGTYAVGNHCMSSILPLDDARNTNWFYFFSDLEILTDAAHRCLICYGDSITAQSWPDDLNLLLKEKEISDTAVVRKATSGSRILREYHCITYESYGLKATNRFPHEIPVAGADTILIQQGINDIIHPVGVEVNPFRPMSDLPTPKEMIEGLRYYIRESRKLGLRVYMGTLLPIRGWRTFAPFREELRCAINDWIRTTDEIDGCVDFAHALENPEDPVAFLPAYDSGDHLHPSEEGYRIMAQTAFHAIWGKQ